ncbi:hypothetical protein EJ02DRAFT_452059 [Clathrospora elynae]|uniref:Ecp2 effector protein domain-containing protein n=1 Tax=Clathrospora elynae TaxID=706981 RepID=A0A6A5SZX5_9PLEO|nr:hypothetical protein EJ02DRAFT_452059 [Clathrospora elynae]
MHLPITNPLIALTVAHSIARVQAGCYSQFGDIQWGPNKELAKAWVDSICTSASLSGTFAAGEFKSQCFVADFWSVAVFVVGWNGSSSDSATLADDECRFRLKNEIGGCSAGGQSWVNGWFFRYV